ncbi:hypothetical protein [Sphingobium yanoikuyae]|uniref:hypothetical protein n=1 Tax=Sphingobium yanoikuyae TaxID=13690 RepID=UPI00031305B4|nr:hypothetical protein [Sphingobium yanoikuyae]
MKLYTKKTADLSRLFKDHGHERMARAVLARDAITVAMVPIGFLIGRWVAGGF